MNGHSSAETLAFNIMEIDRRYGGVAGDREQAPVFILAAGPGSGERELCERLPFVVASELAVAPPLLAAFANQLARLGCVGDRIDGAAGASASTSATASIANAISAQARFVRQMCVRESPHDSGVRWGLASTSLTGDYALYLKLLFPRAKFVFMHRNPFDAFGVLATSMGSGARAVQEEQDFAVRFAEHWCGLVASFELWSSAVGAIMIGYEEAASATSIRIEGYLGERLSRVPSGTRDAPHQGSPPALHPDDAKTLAQHTGGVAARCGYAIEHTPSVLADGRSELRRALDGNPAFHGESGPTCCAVLVPSMRYIEPECDEALMELERRGYTVMRTRGCSSIDQARNTMATAALEQGFEETLWVDADTEFDPDAVERLRSQNLPIVAAVCARRGPRAGLAVAAMPGTRDIVIGEDGGLIEILYAGTGFLLVRREVYTTIQQRFNLPVCDHDKPNRAIPFFMPMLEDWGGSLSYLGEDYAFSRRARLCGYKIMADTSIRLWHIGPYRYGYEDAGNEVARQATYRHVFEPDQKRSS